MGGFGVEEVLPSGCSGSKATRGAGQLQGTRDRSQDNGEDVILVYVAL